MKRRDPPSCRHRAGGRRGVDGCAAAPGGRPWRPRLLALLFAAAVLGWPSSHNLARAACSNGLEGVESSGGDVCCVEACGVCGGEGCSDIGDLDDVDCCTGDIMKTGLVCGGGNTAPCIIEESADTAPSPASGTLSPESASSQDPTPTVSQAPTAAPQSDTLPTASQPASPQPPVSPLPTGAPAGATAPTASTTAPVVASVTTAPSTSPPVVVTLTPVVTPVTTSPDAAAETSTCSNGFPGWQNNDACCSEFCGQCGGEGCGVLGSADCCYDNIISSEKVCGQDTFEAPCIIPDGSPVPAPVVAPGTLAPVSPTQAPAASGTPVTTTTEAPLSRGVPSPTTPPAAPTPTPMPGTSAGATAAPGGTLAPPAATPTPPSETEETCSNGLPGFQHGVVCCPLSCGQCGGSGCENISGTEGGSDCCSDMILSGGADCDSTAVVPVVAPCIVGTVDEVESATEAANAATGLRNVGGAASTIGVACAVAAAAATAACFAH